jgi:competence protein ComEC
VSTASEEELASLPGIGPELARRIAAARPLRSVDELLRVDGIGPKRLAAMRSRVRVGPPMKAATGVEGACKPV